MSYRTDTAALGRLMRTQLGKTILFTDNEDWTDEEIVLGYRAQHHIESAFRDMKNPHFLGWSPMFHWTDSKIRVHAFYCVLAKADAGPFYNMPPLTGLETRGPTCRRRHLRS